MTKKAERKKALAGAVEEDGKLGEQLEENTPDIPVDESVFEKSSITKHIASAGNVYQRIARRSVNENLGLALEEEQVSLPDEFDVLLNKPGQTWRGNEYPPPYQTWMEKQKRHKKQRPAEKKSAEKESLPENDRKMPELSGIPPRSSLKEELKRALTEPSRSFDDDDPKRADAAAEISSITPLSADEVGIFNRIIKPVAEKKEQQIADEIDLFKRKTKSNAKAAFEAAPEEDDSEEFKAQQKSLSAAPSDRNAKRRVQEEKKKSESPSAGALWKSRAEARKAEALKKKASKEALSSSGEKGKKNGSSPLDAEVDSKKKAAKKDKKFETKSEGMLYGNSRRKLAADYESGLAGGRPEDADIRDGDGLSAVKPHIRLTWFEAGVHKSQDIYQFPADIGRDSKCSVYISEPGISRRHARLDKEGLSFTIEDLASLNGTFMEEELVIGKTELPSKAELVMGRVILRASIVEPKK
jgi:hypothetical protein